MRAHVVVFERNAAVRQALVEGLLYEGFVVSPAPNEAAALVALRTASARQLPDVVLLDGREEGAVVEELRGDSRYASIAIVALGGAGPRLGAELEVERPLRLAEVVRAIRLALARRGHAAGAGDEPWPDRHA